MHLSHQPKSPNPAMQRTGSGCHSLCLRRASASLRRSLIFFSLGVFHPMNSYYKLAIVLSRFVAFLILLFDVYSAFNILVLPGLFGGFRNAPPLTFTVIALLAPVLFALVLWFGASIVAKFISRGLD